MQTISCITSTKGTIKEYTNPSTFGTHFSHTRGCSELLDELDAYANKSIVPGYLEYIGPGGAAHSSFRIPGTSHMYRCHLVLTVTL